MSLLVFNRPSLPKAGFVWLVGAGPGAVDLITLRGRDALAAAEVVIHDDLAGQGLLRICPAECERIYVGKRAGHHSATQEEINRLLVAHARAGKRVVRLKGGDPSVFGRLGEELQALRSAGLPFEIVPGVTAACAAAAAAGVSLTQRGLASAAILATGHECAGKSGPALNWVALVQPGATVCVYMGTRSLGALADRLLANGHDPETPLLVISNASLPAQIVRSGTLETARELAREAQDTPSLILIGEIAAQNQDRFAVQHAPEVAYV